MAWRQRRRASARRPGRGAMPLSPRPLLPPRTAEQGPAPGGLACSSPPAPSPGSMTAELRRRLRAAGRDGGGRGADEARRRSSWHPLRPHPSSCSGSSTLSSLLSSSWGGAAAVARSSSGGADLRSVAGVARAEARWGRRGRSGRPLLRFISGNASAADGIVPRCSVFLG
ncbi:hypothetical protein C2845_PM11G04540 [Panicum miliaceum]|uniref:Uncharacterized protein n=1 Tax=Panicum miliaceum TaxID=4540 RepID=A0A3L6RVP7_PANMI|nr:hypothetical protein C2845_PM11G04540 [Panicum miliaceum]